MPSTSHLEGPRDYDAALYVMERVESDFLRGWLVVKMCTPPAASILLPLKWSCSGTSCRWRWDSMQKALELSLKKEEALCNGVTLYLHFLYISYTGGEQLAEHVERWMPRWTGEGERVSVQNIGFRYCFMQCFVGDAGAGNYTSARAGLSGSWTLQKKYSVAGESVWLRAHDGSRLVSLQRRKLSKGWRSEVIESI